MKKNIALLAIAALMLVACAGFQTTKDQAIQYRSQFNLLLSQWNTELMTLPEAQRIDWAKQSIPFVESGAAALEAMDLMADTGGQLTPETVKRFMEAKNRMIDLIAKLIVSKKGA